MSKSQRTEPLLEEILERVEATSRGPMGMWGHALDLVGDAVVVVGTDRRILYFSQGASALTGYASKEVLGEECTRALRCEDCLRRCRLFETGEVCYRRIDLQTRDGRSIPVVKNGRLLRDEEGTVLCGVETLQDISDLDRCQAELASVADQLAIERNLLEAFAESVSDGVLTVDALGRIGSLSHRAADLLGVTQEAGRGQGLIGLLADDGVLASSLTRVLAEGGRVDLTGLRAAAGPGAARLSVRIVGLLGERGQPIGASVGLRPESGPDAKDFHGLIGASRVLRRLMGLIEALAGSDAPVLITGETGSGKEIVARALHRAGARAAQPFVAMGCKAVGEAALESELFGHERGALNGVFREKAGRLEQAESGTIFLDEIASLPPALQGRLLRVLEEGAVERVGATHSRPMRARVIAATEVDLEAAVQRGEFREDLFYRLRVVPIRVPPLRERREDVPHLAFHFAARLRGLKAGRPPDLFTAAALEALTSYGWPGNVRELESAVHYAVATGAGSRVDLLDLPPEIGACARRATGTGPAERQRIELALAKAHYSRVQAAEILGMSRTTLWRKMRQYGL